MNSQVPKSPHFEEEIRSAMAVPDPDAAFLAGLRQEVLHSRPARTNSHRLFFARPAWAAAGLVLAALVIAFLVIGPQQVVTAMSRLFGYIPGYGIVELSSPIRVLAEPVSVTRDGVTVAVNKATLTAEKTLLNPIVTGVPLSAYPKGEAVTGCIDSEYLRLPDGTHQDLNAPVPAQINTVTFVMPCIFNTLPGSVPTDWELPLHFVAAPPDLTVMPVIEATPSQVAASSLIAPSQVNLTGTPLPKLDPAISIDKVIETSDGYILVGWFKPNLPVDARFNTTSSSIYDATGKEVKVTWPQDIDLSYSGPPISAYDTQLAIQFQAAGIVFPLTYTISGEVYLPVDPQATAEVTFDAGLDPQPGQVWTLNQEVQLGGHSVKVVSVTASADGYGFEVEKEEKTQGPDIQIKGYQAIGAGPSSLIFTQMPKGELTIVLSNLYVASSTQSWETQWEPAAPRTDWPTPTTRPASVCLAAGMLAQLPSLPADLTGKVLLSELSQDGSSWNLLFAGLDGSEVQRVNGLTSWAALSPDGKQAAYSDSDGITLLDFTSGKTKLLKGVLGYDIVWSPDGTRLAFKAGGEPFGVYVIDVDGANLRQLSKLGYESIAGWSPDGSQLYFAVPDSSGDGFMLKAVDLDSGSVHDLFVLKDSSLKEPMPLVSPGGKWIAYKGRDMASLYLMSMDGAQQRLVLDKPADAISGLAWSPDSAWLGVSLMTPEIQDGKIVLLKPEGCQVYAIPGLHGMLNGLIMP